MSTYTLLCVSILLSCCTLEPFPIEPSGERLDENPATILLDQSSLAIVAERQYQGDGYQKVNTSNYPTAINSTDSINVYINNADADAFRQIDPDSEDSGVVLNPGATIVREVIGPDGVVKAVTFMIKADPSLHYFPGAGDFYFATVDNLGQGFINDVHGPNQNCASCHLARSNDGYLFGVDRRFRD